MVSKSRSSSPVRRPQQIRSQRTQAAILDVVQRHLGDGSFDHASVNDLVREAGCSVGAFYGRFANKAAALYGFYERNCEELERLAADLLDPARAESLGELLEAFSSLVVRRTFSNAGILRSPAFHREMESGGSFGERAQQMNLRLLDIMQRCLRARREEFSVPASRDTALFVLALIGGMSRDAVVSGRQLLGKRVRFGVRKFESELARAVSGYLGLRE